MNTREQIERRIEETLTAADLAEVDQMMAAVMQGHRHAEANRHLVNHPRIGELIQQRANGGMALSDELEAEAYGLRPTASAVHVQGGQWNCNGIVHELANAEPSKQPLDICDLCFEGRVFDSLDSPAGRTVVEIRVCPVCSEHLEQQWGPLAWSRGHGAV
ncbi:hypothetical protein [Leucobacter komagatae]|nr:hypothetical protein [Leucobacter komagatae]